MSYCPCCPENQSNFNNSVSSNCSSGCCDNGQTATRIAIYQQACYHYQSYLYYWNMYNTQNTYASPVCECYEDLRQSSCHLSGNSNECKDCDVGDYYQTRTRNFYAEFETTGNNTLFESRNDYQGNQDHGANEFAVNDHDDNDDDDDEFEVDESFYQFLKQSQKHKKERERSKRELSNTDEYIEVGKKKISASTLPPEEHQDSKRKKAMKELYGEQASLIMSLETSVQLHFDKNFDERQPIFWPNIPFKF